jgi:hypothetical protein
VFAEGGLVGSSGAYGAPGGKIFYVNTNTASAARNQDRPWFDVDGRTVFSTLQAAIDACVSSRGDIIYIARGTETVTSTVAFNKTGITVAVQSFGGHRKAMGEYTALLADSTFTDGPVATITAPCTIHGLAFAGRDTGATFWSGASCLIGGLATAAPYGVHLHQCRFPKWGLDARIGLSIEGSSDCLIEDCEFEGVGSDLESGIYIQGGMANLEIKDCVFRDCDYALTMGAFAGGGPHLDFHGNRIIGADSKGINTQANTATGTIWNNYFNTDVGTSTFDRTVAQLEVQGLICTGNHYATEATGPT